MEPYIGKIFRHIDINASGMAFVLGNLAMLPARMRPKSGWGQCLADFAYIALIYSVERKPSMIASSRCSTPFPNCLPSTTSQRIQLNPASTVVLW